MNFLDMVSVKVNSDGKKKPLPAAMIFWLQHILFSISWVSNIDF